MKRGGPPTARDKKSRPAPPREVIDRALAAAVEQHRAGHIAEAAAIYQEILHARPGHADTLHLFGVLNAQAGRLTEAVTLLSKAARKQPRNAAFLSDLGNALKQAGRWDEAIATYSRATAIESGDANIHYSLGNALRDAGRLEPATQAYRKALSLQADHLPAQSHLGLALFSMGRGEEAVAVLRRAVEIDPGAAEPHSNLGNALRDLGELKEAEQSLLRALDIKPDYAAAACNLGNVLQDLHRLEAAEAAYRRAIEIDPDYATAHSNLGNALQGLHRLDEAVSCGERAVALDPRRDSHLSNLGVSYVAGGQHDKALECFGRATVLRHGTPLTVNGIEAGEAGDRTVVPFKLKHDVEQIRYLCAAGQLPTPFERVAASYESILDVAPADSSPQVPIQVNRQRWREIGAVYNRPLHLPGAPALEGGTLNPGLDVDAIEAAYLGGQPNIVFFDDLLCDEALERLWRFCLDATIWYQVKHGYLGAYLIDGFGTALTLQIAAELRARFPRIFGDHQLNQMWAYKYDSQLQGIKTHADFAAVNVNFWVTPDAANRDPNSGGLVVHKAVAPSDWAFRKYNSDGAAMEAFLSKVDDEPLVVPYRQNRVVMFDSDLFHRTDDLDFHAGYENRRINVTMLFGDRHEDE